MIDIVELKIPFHHTSPCSPGGALSEFTNNKIWEMKKGVIELSYETLSFRLATRGRKVVRTEARPYNKNVEVPRRIGMILKSVLDIGIF